MSAPFQGAYYIYGSGEVLPARRQATLNDADLLWLAPTHSVLSMGTELWQMGQTEQRVAGGYISISHGATTVVSPTPHGARFVDSWSENLRVRGGLSIERICVARFQLIFALGLCVYPQLLQFPEVQIVGSGPVAFGAAVEAVRRGKEVTVITHRRDFTAHLFEGLPVSVVRPGFKKLCGSIVDCGGRDETTAYILKNAAAGSTIGLVTSPRKIFDIELYNIHRRGMVLVGLHELDGRHLDRRQGIFEEICEGPAPLPIPDSWFRRLSGNELPALMASCAIGDRPGEPFVMLNWS